MPATDCLPIMYVEGMAGWGCVHQSRLPLDFKAASSLLAKRGVLQPGRVSAAAETSLGCRRRERRGAVSFEKTDKNAIYLRKLGDARTFLGPPALQQKRRKEMQRESSERGVPPAAASVPKQKPNVLAKLATGEAHEVKRVLRKHRQRHVVKEPWLVQLLEDCYEVQSKCQLAHISTWSFNVFSLDKTSKGRSLFHVTLELFQLHGLVECFSLDVMKLMKFAALAEDGYHQNPYHNSVHAADVTQALHCFMIQSKVHSFVTPLEKLAAIVAAVTHDLDHPGYSQAFLVATSSPLARLYKNNAVLENHHWRSAMGLLQQSGVISHLTQQLWKPLEQQIKSLILATDMSRQQEFFVSFKTQLDEDNLDMSKMEDRHLLLQIALKCADISNTCRSWYICKDWSEKVCDEFFRQGDREKKLQLPVTNLCDRSKFTVPKIQLGFIDFVVAPLFRLWEKFSGSALASEQLTNLANNRKRWQELAERPDATLTSPLLPIAAPAGVHESSEPCRCSSSRRRPAAADDDDEAADRENRLPQKLPGLCDRSEGAGICEMATGLDPTEMAELAKRLGVRRHSTPTVAKRNKPQLPLRADSHAGSRLHPFGSGGSSLPPIVLGSLARRASLPLVVDSQPANRKARQLLDSHAVATATPTPEGLRAVASGGLGCSEGSPNSIAESHVVAAAGVEAISSRRQQQPQVSPLAASPAEA